MSVGEDGGHETWAANTNAVAYYQIDCDNAYEKVEPFLGHDVIFIGDANADADDDDDVVIGCPGWDTVSAPSKDDRGGMYHVGY